MTKEAEQMFTNELNDLVDEQMKMLNEKATEFKECEIIDHIIDTWNHWYKYQYETYHSSMISYYKKLKEDYEKRNQFKPLDHRSTHFICELEPSCVILTERQFDYIVEKRKEYDKENES